MSTMKAAVIYEAGGPSQLKVESRPIPTASAGEVLIRVRAAGLNRSEMFTRQGHSPSVKFPRVLGIEATGEVVDAPGGEFQKGEKVATAMGEMGRAYDGGYAEYTVVPAKQVQRLKTNLTWETIGALPEMVQTSWGSLFLALDLKPDDRLLVRGGTSSVGLAAIALAKSKGAYVAATSRKQEAEALVKEYGADRFFVDSGNLSEIVKSVLPEGFDKCLELIGVKTVEDSLRCVRRNGVVCITGIAGGQWELDKWNPMAGIPLGRYLTVYGGGPEEFMQTPLQEICDLIEGGKLYLKAANVFKLDDIVGAHEMMDANKAGGKIVVLL